MVRFGIIGTNFITDSFIEAGREVHGFALTAVCSRTEQRAREFSAKHQIPHRFTDVEAMLKSGVVDAVYIASPNALHAGQAILCMNYGKHVLCEKPIASNARETERMFAAAERNGVVLMEAMMSTALPNFAAIREHLPKIGPVRRFLANYCKYSSRYDAYKAGELPNAFNPELSNGALMDLGVYCVHPMVELFGKPERIAASGLLLASGADGEGTIVCKYPDMEAVLIYSKITNSALPSEIQGEAGSIVIDKISVPERVEIRYNDGTVQEIGRPQNGKPMVYEIRAFIDAVQQGLSASPVNPPARSLVVMEIVDEARRQIGLAYPADRMPFDSI